MSAAHCLREHEHTITTLDFIFWKVTRTIWPPSGKSEGVSISRYFFDTTSAYKLQDESDNVQAMHLTIKIAMR